QVDGVIVALCRNLQCSVLEFRCARRCPTSEGKIYHICLGGHCRRCVESLQGYGDGESSADNTPPSLWAWLRTPLRDPHKITRCRCHRPQLAIFSSQRIPRALGVLGPGRIGVASTLSFDFASVCWPESAKRARRCSAISRFLCREHSCLGDRDGDCRSVRLGAAWGHLFGGRGGGAVCARSIKTD